MGIAGRPGAWVALLPVLVLTACTATPEPGSLVPTVSPRPISGPAETVGATLRPSPAPSPAPTSAGSASPSAAPTTGPSAAPTAGPSATPWDPRGVRVRFTTVATVPGRPLAIANARDGTGRLFVAEQGGRVFILEDGAVAPTPFLDLSGRVSAGGEQGLLGLAFHPDFPADNRVFVDYTDVAGDTVVASFTVDPATPDVAAPASEVVVLAVLQPFANHNGGAIAFGPDGYLYVALGDGGSGGDPQGNGQRLSTLLGKILRIDVDRTEDGREYAIPDTNPFAGTSGARGEIWLVGLRNPFRSSFDRETGDLWIGDVGQGAWEEVDVARAGVGGLNFGWRTMEGAHCYSPVSGCRTAGLELPVVEYPHDFGCAVIGGHVYRGTDSPLLRGGYLFSDACSGITWAVDARASGPAALVQVGAGVTGIAGYGEDEAGELYAANLAGQIYRVSAEAR